MLYKIGCKIYHFLILFLSFPIKVLQISNEWQKIGRGIHYLIFVLKFLIF